MDRNRRMTYICEFALKKTITLYINLKNEYKTKEEADSLKQTCLNAAGCDLWGLGGMSVVSLTRCY